MTRVLTRVRWSATESAKVWVRTDAVVYVERFCDRPPEFVADAEPQTTSLLLTERTAYRTRIRFPANYSGPMEADTAWIEVPNHNPDPRVGADYEAEFRKGFQR